MKKFKLGDKVIILEVGSRNEGRFGIISTIDTDSMAPLSHRVDFTAPHDFEWFEERHLQLSKNYIVSSILRDL